MGLILMPVQGERRNDTAPSGRLKMDEGVFGPGAFVWYPEGAVMRHGATEDEDGLFLYIQDGEGRFEVLE